MTMTLSSRSQQGQRSNLRLMLYLLKYAVSWVEIWCDDASWSVGYLGKVWWPCPQSQGHSRSMFKFTIIAISLKLLGLLGWNLVWWYILVGLDRSNLWFLQFPLNYLVYLAEIEFILATYMVSLISPLVGPKMDPNLAKNENFKNSKEPRPVKWLEVLITRISRKSVHK